MRFNHRKSAIIAAAMFAIAGRAYGSSVNSLSTLYGFPGQSEANPMAGLIADSAGNLYGTTSNGGPDDLGTVFELAGPNHQTFIPLAFLNTSTGTHPQARLFMGSDGNLYGTTFQSGQNGDGTVFELSGANHQTMSVLVAFNGSNGFESNGGLIDMAGNFCGTTYAGGPDGWGTVYELTGPNHQTVSTLVTFNVSNGSHPVGELVADSTGDLYGTTSSGGPGNAGTVFELSGINHTTLTTVFNFNSTVGSGPLAGLTIDAQGDLFGTTANSTTSGGIAFELSGASHQTFTLLASLDRYATSNAAGYSAASMIFDAAGNLFGTTAYGGTNDGTVFELSGPTHQDFSVLADFTNAVGATPYSGLVADSSGNLYGTTSEEGPSGIGSVFELSGSGFAVPEPSGLLVLSTSLCMLARRRGTHTVRCTA